MAIELSRSVLIDSAWLVVVALWSRAWLLNRAAKISFTSFAKKDVPIWDVAVAGVDVFGKTMEFSGTPSGVVASAEDDEEDGLGEDGMKSAAAMLVGAIRGT